MALIDHLIILFLMVYLFIEVKHQIKVGVGGTGALIGAQQFIPDPGPHSSKIRAMIPDNAGETKAISTNVCI